MLLDLPNKKIDYTNPSKAIQEVHKYVNALREEIDLVLQNLDDGNMDTTFTGSIFGRIESAEGGFYDLTITVDGLRSTVTSYEGQVSSFEQTVNGFTTEVSNYSGQVSQFQQTVNGFTTEVSNYAGQVSRFQQTVNGFTTEVSNYAGQVSSFEQTVDGFTLTVTSNGTDSYVSLNSNGITLSSAMLTIAGVVKFIDLSTAGLTTINGSNITTGTITAITINACNISGSIFRTLLKQDGAVSGQICFDYLNDFYTAGGIRLDDSGNGSVDNARYRMFIYTNITYNQFTGEALYFALKLQSAGGMSLVSGLNLWQYAATDFTLSAGLNLYLVNPKIQPWLGSATFYTFASDGIYYNSVRILAI